MASEVVGTLIDNIGNFQSAVDTVVELSKTKSNIYNKTNMSNKIKLAALLAVLALNELVIEDGNASLNEQHLEAIDTALSAGTQAQNDIAAAKTDLQKANADIAELNKKIAELEKSAGAEPAKAVETENNNEPNIYTSVRNELKGKS
jgi:hypothetical protein